MLRLIALLLLVAPALPASGQLALRADTVYTMAGAPIPNGVVLVRDGKIERVGAADRVQIPNGYRVVTGQIITPGLIDARSTVGLSGVFNQAHDQDHLETSEAIQPELRALDAYNGRDTLVAWLRGFGITTVQTGPSPGALSSGQMMIVKTWPYEADAALVRDGSMVSFTLGEGLSSRLSRPGTRSKGAAMLRADLLKARDYARKMADSDEDKRPDRDLRLEALARVLNREVPALVSAHRAHDILTALRLKEEFGFDMVLDGGAEAYLVIDELRAANVPVIVHPTMMRAGGAGENVSMDTAARLRAAGIPIAFQSGYEGYVPKTRVVLFEAGVAAGLGDLPRQAALEALTVDAARLLGIADRVGTLEAGKDADVVVWDGDPLEYMTHTCTVVIGGDVVSETCR